MEETITEIISIEEQNFTQNETDKEQEIAQEEDDSFDEDDELDEEDVKHKSWASKRFRRRKRRYYGEEDEEEEEEDDEEEIFEYELEEEQEEEGIREEEGEEIDESEESEDESKRKVQFDAAKSTRSKRASYFARKQSRKYTIKMEQFQIARIFEDKKISGDFGLIPIVPKYMIEKSPSEMLGSISSGMELESEEEEEDFTEEFDRGTFLHDALRLNDEFQIASRKNSFLQKRMIEHYRKKKMEYKFKESEESPEMAQKYKKKLDALADYKSYTTFAKGGIDSVIQELTEERDQNQLDINSMFKTLQETEKSNGMGLITLRTGKEVPPKTIEKYIERQYRKWIEVSEGRLAYFRAKDLVQEKLQALDDMDKVGEGLHLMDYEQLKIEYQMHMDKFEERDDELSKLRKKGTKAILCLAHAREKLSELRINLEDRKETLKYKKLEYTHQREQLNSLKLKRDRIRKKSYSLRENSGLLLKSKLLCDLERIMKEMNYYDLKIEEAQIESENLKEILAAIKININRVRKLELPEKVRKRKELKSEKSSCLHRGRPSLLIPLLPRSSDLYY